MAEQYPTPQSYKDALQYILGESKNIYEAKKAAGYTPYTGARIAGFSPEEQAAMGGIANLVGMGQTYFNPAEALTYGQTQKFGDVAQQYMSPYQQAVVDVQKREAVRQAERGMQDIGASAVSRGGFGGSRQAILEAEASRNLQQQLGDIQTRGSQAAYETGMRAFEAQKERERAAASGLAALGQAAPKQALAELAALSGVGEAQRGLTQAGLDLGYQQFQEQQQYPYSLLGQYQSTVYGYPYQAYAQYQPTPKASGLQNIAGVLGAVGKIAGPSGFGFFNTGGRVAYQSNGGLAGMIQKLADGMTVGSDNPLAPTVSAESPLGQDLQKAEMLKKMMTGYSDYQKALQAYSQQAKDVMAERQKLAEERQAELEKEKSPINYISDLLIGYAAADPEAGLGAQLGGAAQYASEKREALDAEIRQIQDDLASGKISQEEANLKLQAAQLESQGELYKSLGYDDDSGTGSLADDFTKLEKVAANVADVIIQPDGSIKGEPAAKRQYKKYLDTAIKIYRETGDRDEALAAAIASIMPNTSVVDDTSVTNDATTSSSSDVSDDDIAGKISAFGNQSSAISNLPKS